MRMLWIFVALVLTSESALAGLAAFSQEFPPPGTVEVLNGARLFRGWKCNHGTITRSINGGDPEGMASNLARGDTSAICGNPGANGYAELINVGNLGRGRHTIEFFDDGEKFAQAEFDVVLVADDTFLGPTDLTSETRRTFFLPGFPVPGEGVYVTWFQGEQGFFVRDWEGDVAGRSQTTLQFAAAPPTDWPSSRDLVVRVAQEGDDECLEISSESLAVAGALPSGKCFQHGNSEWQLSYFLDVQGVAYYRFSTFIGGFIDDTCLSATAVDGSKPTMEPCGLRGDQLWRVDRLEDGSDQLSTYDSSRAVPPLCLSPTEGGSMRSCSGSPTPSWFLQVFDDYLAD